MYRRLTLLFFLAILLLDAQAQADTTKRKIFKSTAQTLKENSPEDAIAIFSEMINAATTNADLYLARGKAFLTLGKYQEALKDFESVRGQNVETPSLLGMIGVCKYHLNDPDAAENMLERAIKSGVKDPLLFSTLGYVRYDKHKYKEAIESLKIAHAGNEKDLRIFVVRGKAYYKNGDHTHAIADLEKASTQEDSEINEFLGLAYMHLGKFNEAMKYLELAATAQSTNTEVYFQIGNGRTQQKNFAGAVEAYNKSISLGAADEVVYNNRGEAELALGDMKKALTDFQRSTSIKPDYGKALRNTALADYQLKNWQGTIIDLAMAGVSEKLSPDELAMGGIAKFNLKNYPGAVEDLTKAITAGAKNKSLIRTRGDAYHAQQDDKNAILDYTKAIQLDPKDADAYASRSALKKTGKDYTGALADITLAINSNNNVPAFFRDRGTLEFLLGQTDKACADWNKAADAGDAESKKMTLRDCAK